MSRFVPSLLCLLAACGAPAPASRDGATSMLAWQGTTPSTQPPPPPCTVTVVQALAQAADLIAPLSTSRATTRTPTLEWSSCAAARVQICADRDCAVVLSETDVNAHEYTPAADLAGNGDVYFWRVQNRVDDRLGVFSDVWEVFVPAVSAAHSTEGGTVLDLDLDGLADFAVGDYGAEGARGVASGVVHVYRGAGRVGTSPSQTLTQPVPEEDALFGGSLAPAGDVNGDGFADLIVGANQAYGLGAAYVFFGDATGFDPDATELVGEEPSGFGFQVSSAGDVDGDGHGDVLVGAPAYGGVAKTGAAYLFRGRPGTTPSLGSPAAVLFGSGTFSSEFGSNVGGVGDLNGDGYGDIAASENYFTFWTNTFPQGRVYVWYGSADGIDPAAGVEVISPDAADSDGFGFTISDATDVDGDGYHDLVVGSSGANGFDGAVYAYFGGPTGIDPSAPSLVVDPAPPQAAFFGHAVSGAGDLDDDGVDDLVIGETDANALAGRIHVDRTGDPAVVQVANPDPSADFFGGDVLIVGDTNGDGRDDFLVGAGGTAHLFLSESGPPTVGDAIPLSPASPTFGNLGR